MINRDNCWLFAGYKNTIGYGQIFYTVDGKTKYQYAHRVSYETFNGPIPDGLAIDHLCSIRHCINPSHLEAVTLRENTLRGEGVIVNKKKTNCPQGHPYSLENTTYNNKGWRVCRTCKLIRHAKYYRANKDKWPTVKSK